MGGIQIPFIDSESTENESSSLELELIVDKEKEEKKPTEIGQSFNAYSYDPSVLKDKPWLKPGSDITDYFNYGFTEKTWMKYCEMQRENREWGGRQNKLERETNDRGYERRYRASDNEGRERRRVGNEGQHWRGHEEGRRLPSEDSYGRTYNDGRQYYNNDDRKYYRNDDRRSYNDSYDRRSYNDSYDRKYSNDFYDRKTYKDSYDDKYSKRSRKN